MWGHQGARGHQVPMCPCVCPPIPTSSQPLCVPPYLCASRVLVPSPCPHTPQLSEGVERYISKFEIDHALSNRSNLIIYLDKVRAGGDVGVLGTGTRWDGLWEGTWWDRRP